jgi:putative sigma-54 modulation protein
MNIIITARKFKAHQSLKDYINEEVSSITKFHDDILSVEIILSFLNNKENIKISEIIVHVPGQTLTAIEQTEDFKKSVNASIEKIIRQLRKLKTKRISRINEKVEIDDQAGF